VRRISPTGADLGNFVSGFPGAEGIAFDVHGNLFVSSFSTNIIEKYSPEGVDLGVFASIGAGSAYGLAFDREGNLYVANFSGVVRKFSPTGADLGAFANASTGLSNPRALVVPAPVVLAPACCLAAAVLPSSRSVQVGGTATVFGTILNGGSNTATGCVVAPITGIPATFHFQTTNPATNQVTGGPDAAVDIGSRQTYVLSFTPTAPFPPTDVRLSFNCANASPAPVTVGLNTLLLSASATPVPDVVALAATVTNDGIVNIAGTSGTGAFAVATVNVGASGSITVSADTGNATLPVNISLCQTNPASGQCISTIGASVTTQINSNATPTFAIFVQGHGNVPFDPATNRIFVRFREAGAVTRGSTSVAVRTQ